MRYVVKRYWEVCDEVRVEAYSVDTAIEAAHALPLNHTQARPVPDSLNTDPDADVYPMAEGDAE